MSHIEIHTIKGREYRYEVTNYRVGKKVKHKWNYLGAVNPVNNRRNPNAGRNQVQEKNSTSLQRRPSIC